MLSTPLRSLSGLALVLLLLPACPWETPVEGPDPSPEGACSRDIDCAAGGVCRRESPDDAFGTCRGSVCLSDGDCELEDECHLATAVCVPLLDCVSDGGCEAGERCLVEGQSASCVAEADLPASSSCQLLPRAPALTEGARTRVDVEAVSESGQLEPFAAFTLAADAGSVEGERGATFSYTAACEGPAPCRVELRALTGDDSLACVASVLVLPPAPEGDVRVVLVDESDGQPIADALVTLRTQASLLEAVTDEYGSAVFSAVSPASVLALSVLPEGHDWHSVVGLTSSDVLLMTRPTVLASEAAGARGSVDFSDVRTIGDIRMAVGGLSLERGLSGRFSLGSVLGEVQPHVVVIDGVTDAGGEVLQLPLGLEMHLGTSALSPGFVALSRPGPRLSWALAGRVRLSQLGPMVSGLSSGEATFGDGLAEMLVFARAFDHAVGPVLTLERGARPDSGVASLTDWDLPLIAPEELSASVFPRLTTSVTLPLLPCAPGSSGDGCPRMPSGLASITALSALGQVPLGIAHGEDDPDDDDGVNERDGLVNARTGALERLPPGVLQLTTAPLHDGLEGKPRVLTSLAFDIERALDDDAAVSLMQMSAPAAGVPEVSAPAFLGFARGTFTQGASSGSLALTESAAGADVHRFHLESADGAGWHVWLVGEASGVGFADLLPDGVTPRHESAVLQALSLSAVVLGDAPVTLPGLLAPDGTSLGDLRRYTRGISSAPCPLAGGAPSACVTVDE